MTVHSAKGLEFTHVYIIGLEENLFPSVNSSSSESEIEEERRLMYVALTRAKKSITISYAQSRFRWGSHVSYPPSRFLREINPKFLNWPDLGQSDGFGNSSLSGFSGNTGNFGNSRISGNSGNRFVNRYGSSGSQTHISDARSQSSNPQSQNINPPKPSFTPPKPANPNFNADPVSKLATGQKIEHDRFGYGKIITIEGDPLNLKAVVDFDEGGRKILLLKFAKLRVVE